MVVQPPPQNVVPHSANIPLASHLPEAMDQLASTSVSSIPEPLATTGNWLAPIRLATFYSAAATASSLTSSVFGHHPFGIPLLLIGFTFAFTAKKATDKSGLSRIMGANTAIISGATIGWIGAYQEVGIQHSLIGVLSGGLLCTVDFLLRKKEISKSESPESSQVTESQGSPSKSYLPSNPYEPPSEEVQRAIARHGSNARWRFGDLWRRFFK